MKFLCGMVALVFFTSVAWGQATVPAEKAAQAFGARAYVRQISLSPDGSHVAIVAPLKGRGNVLLIGDLAHGGVPNPVLTSSGDPDRLQYCHWSTNTRLVCGVYMIMGAGSDASDYTRLITLNSDGSDVKQLSQRTGTYAMAETRGGGDVIDWMGDGNGTVLMTSFVMPGTQTGNLIGQRDEGLAVDRVDTTTLKRVTVERPRRDAVEYITDGRGKVRIMGLQASNSAGQNEKYIKYLYRTADSNTWKPLGQYDVDTQDGFNPYAVDPDMNVVYGFDKKDGRQALYRISLDGSMKRELVLARPDVDVDGLIRVGRQDRVVGASYATDSRYAEYFDPALKSLRDALGKALPGKPIVSFVDASADENKLLLYAGSDNDPGTYYLFDKTTHKLGEVTAARPDLHGVKLATQRAIQYPAADGTMIPAYLTLPVGSDGKNLPAIVMPHGGPSSRDEWGFDWLSQFFAARGYAVIQPNFRGSSGYGDAWFKNNGFQSWKTAVGDVNDAGRWLVKQGIAAPDKLAIFGWSYGGYAALQSSVLDPGLFKAIVAVAPVTDLDALREEYRWSSDFNRATAFIGTGPHIEAGSPARHADMFKAPVLLFHGDQDRNVGIHESELMEARLKRAGKQVQFVEFKGLDHQLNDGEARAKMLSTTDSFLRQSMHITTQ